MYEAARAICNLPGVEMNDLSPAINVLQVWYSLCTLTRNRIRIMLDGTIYCDSR